MKGSSGRDSGWCEPDDMGTGALEVRFMTSEVVAFSRDQTAQPGPMEPISLEPPPPDKVRIKGP